MSLAAAFISFAGCQKNEFNGVENTVDGAKTFELVADIAQTKTTLDGYSVEWEEGDVIYMVTADGTWGKPYSEDSSTESIAAFTYADGKFTTDATIAKGSYEFRAIYSNGSQMSYHRSDKTTNQLQATQSQDCSDPTAHIKKNDALVGTFTATTPMADPAKVTMSHLYTMMQVNVKNNTGAQIEVTKFEMTAEGADLAGVFTVNAFDTPSISAKVGETDTETITVNVAGGSVASGASLPVYFVMAPLNNYSGNVTFKVTDAEGNTYSKTVETTSKSFEAGKYNTTSYTISEADAVVPGVDYSGEYAAVVLKSEKYVYLTSDVSGKRLATVDSGVSEITDYTTTLADFATVNPEYVWTIKKIENSSYYTMCANSKYIKKVSTSSNYAYVDVSINNAEPLSLEYDEEGKYFTITSTTTNYSGRTLSVNESNDYFAFYGNTSQLYKIVLIPYEEDTMPKLLAPANVQFEVDNINKTISITWDVVENATSYEVNLGGKTSNVTEPTCQMTVSDFGIYDLTITSKADGYRSAMTETIKVEVTNPQQSTSAVEFVCSNSVFSAVDGILSATISPITITQEKGNGSNFNTDFTNPLRFYGANTLTISGAVITKVEITYDDSYNKDNNIVVDSGVYNDGIWTSTTDVNSVVFKNGTSSQIGQVRITKIKVTYKN